MSYQQSQGNNIENYILHKFKNFINFDLEQSNSSSVDKEYIIKFINDCYPYLNNALSKLIDEGNVMSMSDSYIYNEMMKELQNYINNEYNKRITNINYNIELYIVEPMNFTFKMYEYDYYGLPIDNLDEIAIHGFANIEMDLITEKYKTDYMENPTWLDLCKVFQDISRKSDYKVFECLNKIGFGSSYTF